MNDEIYFIYISNNSILCLVFYFFGLCMLGLGRDIALSLKSSIGLRFLFDCWLTTRSLGLVRLGLLILLSFEELFALNDVYWCGVST